MLGFYERVKLIRNLTWSFQQALVYSISELLDLVVGHKQTITSNSLFLLRSRFLLRTKPKSTFMVISPS